ncbi:FAD-linked oxidase C-terminal domain-containing protein [Kitasatospora sp. NPDC094015]|uniref:FAD-linked oxidase C-terminal domain-containing protein n=1 Tax=Kitasatospora sp. NPDC094015 TaxID=3155205 RepID=UPI00333344AE
MTPTSRGPGHGRLPAAGFELCHGPRLVGRPAGAPARQAPPAPGLAAFAAEARELLGAERVLTDPTTLGLHSYDASLDSRRPDAVVVPRSGDDLRELVLAAGRGSVPWVVRGAGTGYSGGALPDAGGAVLLTRDLDRILAVDPDRRLVRCEPGVVLADLREALAPYGLRYLPDPSSYQVCTVGGNVAENAGGPHALAVGPTSNFVVSLDVVLPDGSTAEFGEEDVWRGGLDLRGLLVGSEGTLGAVRGLTLRVAPEPECSQVLVARFDEQDAAAATVERVLGIGLLPSAIDMITSAYVPGAPVLGDPSLLFIEVEGTAGEVRHQAAALTEAAAQAGGRCELLSSRAFMATRARLVKEKVRRMVTTSGRPCYYLFDAVVPRSRLTTLMAALRRRADQHDLPILNTFHAADGNVHPAPFYDPADPDYRTKLRGFLADVLADCAALDGSLSGEHGVGLEKAEFMPLFHSPRELLVMRGIKDAFDPAGLCNPGKILPEPDPEPAPRPADHGAGAVRGARRAAPGGSPALRVRAGDGAVDIGSPEVSFAAVAHALRDTGLELVHEPLGGGPESSVLTAIDRGRPALRETLAVRARDLVLSAGLAVGRQEVLTVGGSCTKDVSGYELRRLAFGGRGRIGRLTSVSLRLLPSPTDRRSLEVEAADPGQAALLCRELHRLGLPFTALGVLLDRSARVLVTGLLEVRGGTLDEHAARLRTALRHHGFELRACWSPLDSPAVTALAGASDLEHRAGQPWQSVEVLRRLHDAGGPAFASVGPGALWYPRGVVAGPDRPPSCGTSSLGSRVAAAFEV